MRVFLAGASGVIGRSLVPRLVAHDQQVVAITRTPPKADSLRERGAEPAICDALDAEALERAMVEAVPDAVINHLTDIPRAVNPRRAAREFEANDRLRSEGTVNMVAAARAAGVRRIVAQSVAFFYAPGEPPIRTEDNPLFTDGPPPIDRSAAALQTLDAAVTQTDGVEGVVLRFGFWYGPGTVYASDGSTAEMVRKRRYPVVGNGAGVFSFVHIDDVVEATLAALDAPPGIYNVTDDDPAPAHEWLPAYAEALGAPRPRRVPALVARLAAGRFAVHLMTELNGASNEKAKRDLGWAPKHPSWRDGFTEALG
ncbi:MAG: NAD-dependent epimerase/dehydratase family protein [Solirubrobacterales bacterium]